MNRRLASSFRHPTRQRGVVLIVALLVLVATILAAVALVRSVDVATLVSGNLAFRQAGVQAADSGVELARNWLMSVPIADLDVPAPTFGYYATSNTDPTKPFDPFAPGVWSAGTTSRALPTDAVTGNTVEYVVHRMCQDVGDPANANCFTAHSVATGGTSMRIREPGDLPCFDPHTGANLCGVAVNPYYRITVKVTGPRNTVTYAQAVIY